MATIVYETPKLQAYDEAMEAAQFMRDQAYELLENAKQIEFNAKQWALEFVGEQSLGISLRHTLMCKELGIDISIDGPSPNLAHRQPPAILVSLAPGTRPE